jgi:hypothetical protein
VYLGLSSLPTPGIVPAWFLGSHHCPHLVLFLLDFFSLRFILIITALVKFSMSRFGYLKKLQQLIWNRGNIRDHHGGQQGSYVAFL